MEYTFTQDAVRQFKAQWPCSGIPELSEITFDFDFNGLVDIVALDANGEYIDSAEFDGPALVAMSQDAQKVIEAL